ncbi:MAG: aminotransferase class I/II-fold pyridoxal phosphate-dependent enzyme [Planctomycetes bacterium]|nr:aminotransferase class I/II-fold pyridoxal phosphate-dependent enzyme [Planctomycetota bacterium]
MKQPIVDLRSDTVTQPSPEMRRAMAEAEVGDDVFGEDPTVRRLQERVATLLGKEAALFVPSGSMANQTAIRAQTQPGDEIIAHADSHIYHYEAGGPAALSGCSMRLLEGPGGTFDADAVNAALRPKDSHFPQSALIVIENTHNRGGGTCWNLDEIARIREVADAQNLRMHLDGARLMNACVATGHKPPEYTQYFDTVSTCFSKGLGAPVGSVVAGTEATIRRVHRFRKMFGGGMRQAGVIAAAALYAIEHNIDRLADDHANAKRLAEGAARATHISVDPDAVETNIVFLDVDASVTTAAALAEQLRGRGVLMLATGPQRLRAVTHLDVSSDQIDAAIAAICQTADTV